MNLKAITEWQYFRPVLGGVLAVLCGLILWATPMGDWWGDTSYDYQFRFGSRPVTNQVVLIQMDNESYYYYDQDPQGLKPWNRALHAKLLNRLADGGAALVVMDTFFRAPRDPAEDQALIEALHRQSNVVIMAEQAEIKGRRLEGVEPVLPDKIFLDAARGNTGVAWFDPDSRDLIVRKHWPFPSPGPSTPAQFFSLPWVAATLAGARLDNDNARERWLRYYHEGAWTSMSYRHAMEEDPRFFHGKIVFIGRQPHTTNPEDLETDKFRTPYTRWTGEAYGGVNINITAFLNLMNGDWLERTPEWLEALVIILAGILLGGGLCRLRPLPALWTAVGVAFAITLVAVSLTHVGNHWFPWLVIVAGQVPFALVWAIFMPAFHRMQETITIATLTKGQKVAATKKRRKTPADELPEAPDYELFDPPFGEGAYGRVWVVKNAVGEFQALKVVYLSKFENNKDPFDREFNGISHYKPISDKHPGLLRVDFVTRKREAYFYYVMELGDALVPGWEDDPASYKPRDLQTIRAQLQKKRLPIRECVRIGIALSDALEFLHQQGLTHRDIKPQNIIFVKGQPKLADVGLTAEIRPDEEERTFVGTPGYMPPRPELPGTPQADIYALGMVLFVVSTGQNVTFFPEIATTLVQDPGPADYLLLNDIILTACNPDISKRYKTAAQMRQALLELEKSLPPA